MTNVYRVQQQYPNLLIFIYSLGPILITVCHVGSFLLLATGLSWQAFSWGFILYWIRMLGITGIYHRLIIHKSYQAPAMVKWVGSLVACSAGQIGPNWWKGHHLQGHHNRSDTPEDAHSPNAPYKSLKGFLWSQCGWHVFGNLLPDSLPADVESDGVLKIIDRLHFLPLVLLGVISYWIGGMEFLGAFFLSTTILFHGVALVNSLAHVAGEQPFVSNDNSRNNWFVAFATLGEGWHNLHHAAQWSARHGYTIRDGKIVRLPDPTYWFIKLLEKFNLASNIKLPTDEYLLGIANKVEVRQF